MTLATLIEWLAQQDQALRVKHGFSSPHSDRGDYYNLAFSPEPESTIAEMLKSASGAVERTFQGYKGGDYKMGASTSVYIGKWGDCGEEITSYTFRYWLLTAAKVKPDGE